MKLFLTVSFVLCSIRMVSYGLAQIRNNQKKGAFGTFLHLAIFFGVLLLTFCIGHS